MTISLLLAIRQFHIKNSLSLSLFVAYGEELFCMKSQLLLSLSLSFFKTILSIITPLFLRRRRYKTIQHQPSKPISFALLLPKKLPENQTPSSQKYRHLY